MHVRGASTVALGALFLAAALGCKGSPSAANCPVPVNPPCPDAAPDFVHDIQPIFQVACVRCHSPSGEEPKSPLITYQEIYGRAGAIYTQVFEWCSMPPPSAPEILTDVQRQRLLEWYACGAPETGAADAGAP